MPPLPFMTPTTLHLARALVLDTSQPFVKPESCRRRSTLEASTQSSWTATHNTSTRQVGTSP